MSELESELSRLRTALTKAEDDARKLRDERDSEHESRVWELADHNAEKARAGALQTERDRLRTALDTAQERLVEAQRVREQALNERDRLRTALGENMALLQECHHYQNRLPQDCVLRLRAAIRLGELEARAAQLDELARRAKGGTDG